MQNVEHSTSSKALMTRSPMRLMTASQASTFLRAFVTDSFSSYGPEPYKYRSQLLYSPIILIDWLKIVVSKMEGVIERELSMAHFPQHGNDAHSDEHENEDEDDDGDDN